MQVDYEVLKQRLKATKRGSLLLNNGKKKFITTIPQQIETSTSVEHPLLDVLSDDAFVPPNATIPVISDDDVLSVFQECDAMSELPRFLFAGARHKYKLDPAHLTVGVLTAGGNAPGIDAIVDSLVKRQFLLGTERCKKIQEELTEQEGYPPKLKFYGILGGYQGLQNLKNAKDRHWVMELHPRLTDAWAVRGCSSLHALRTSSYNPGEKKDKFDHFIDTLTDNVRKLKLDILYTVGGNGTMTVADVLGKKLLNDKVNPCIVVAAPKTMDNDVNFTDVTFGFRTTVDNAIRLLRDIHREAETLERVGIVELFGADSGFVSLHAAYASGETDYVMIPEKMGGTVGSARKELNNAIRRIQGRANKKGHALLVIAEGATIKANAAIMADKKWLKCCQTKQSRRLESFQHGKKGDQDKAFANLVDYVKRKTGHNVFFNQPKHLIRSTPPNGFDMDLCKYTGKLMVDTALSSFTCCAIHLWQGNYVLVPLETAVADLKRVDTTGYYFITMWERYLLG
jgi:6-phosphofructokinase 1